jgi:transposase
LYSKTGRPSIAPEKLLRALLLQALYSVRSERMLMEQLDYNLLFRWFVGLNMDDDIWDVTVFTKNRERLLDGDIAEAFFQAVLRQARERNLLSDEHFTVDGTLLEAWASLKSFQRKDGKPTAPPDDPSNATVDFHGEKRSNATHESKTDPDAKLARKGKGKEAKLSYNGNLLVENSNGLIVNTEVFEANGTAERDAALVMLEQLPGVKQVDGGRRQGVRHSGLRGRVPKPKGHATCIPEPGAAGWECD